MSRPLIDTLRAIHSYVELHGYPPTLLDIGAAIGTSSRNTTQRHMVRLERDGWIERRCHTARSIRITQLGMAQLELSE